MPIRKVKAEEVVEQEVRIKAKPETVFAFFIDPKKMVRWKGLAAQLDPKPGGIYRVDVTGRDIARGEYKEVVPFQKVVFTWGWEGVGHPVPPGSTTVEVTLTAAGDETIVRLRHYGLSQAVSGQHDQGWAHYMSRLVVAASGGDPGPDPHVTQKM